MSLSTAGKLLVVRVGGKEVATMKTPLVTEMNPQQISDMLGEVLVHGDRVMCQVMRISIPESIQMNSGIEDRQRIETGRDFVKHELRILIEVRFLAIG